MYIQTKSTTIQLKAAVKVNTEMLKFYWSLGEDICEKQKQYKWGANFMKRLSLDLRAEFPKAEGFSVVNLYYIKRWFVFYSSHTNFFYQAGKKLQEVKDVASPMPEILLSVPWRHQTVIVSKCETIEEYYAKKRILKISILFLFGDPHGARTHDPNIKSVVLYQLS